MTRGLAERMAGAPDEITVTWPARAAAFDEAKHPRDRRGRFGRKGPLDYTPLLGRDFAYDKISTGGGQDPALAALARMRGFDGPPDVVSDAELDRRVAGGEREMWRGFNGINAGQQEQTRRFARTLLDGPYFAGAGHAGNGTYVSAAPDPAAELAEIEQSYRSAPRGPDGQFTEEWVRHSYARDLARVTDRGRDGARAYASSHGTLVRMTLDKDARVAGWDDLSAKWRERYLALMSAAASGGEREKRELALLNDPGRFAVIAGYDAVDISRIAPGEMLILNRTALHVSSRLQDSGEPS